MTVNIISVRMEHNTWQSEPENVFKTNKNILKYPPSVTKLYATYVLSQ